MLVRFSLTVYSKVAPIPTQNSIVTISLANMSSYAINMDGRVAGEYHHDICARSCLVTCCEAKAPYVFRTAVVLRRIDSTL